MVRDERIDLLSTDGSITKLLGTRWTRTSDHCKPSVRTTLLAQYVRPTGIFCCWRHCMEVIAQRHSESEVFCRQSVTLFSQY